MTCNSPDKLLSLLTRHAVPFIVIGGHAVNFHGHVRTTEDLDVIWLRSGQSEGALLEALVEAGAQWISDEIDPATRLERLVPVSLAYVRASRLMMLITDMGFLDLFDYIPGFEQTSVQEAFDDAVESGGVRYVSLAWLKRMKQAAARPQDLGDLQHLE